MQKFYFNVNYVEVSVATLKTISFGDIPFSTVANTFEEGRNKALEFAQSIARCYNANRESDFFFRICTD